MFLKGNTVTLRALEPSDADILYRWENDKTLWNVSFTQVPLSKFVLEDFVNASHNDIYTNKQLRLMIELNNEHKTIGIIDLFDFEPPHARCALGIYIHEDYRKSGCAYQSIELVKEYCFSILHLKQVFVHVTTTNIASIGLFEKSGFVKSGLKKCWHKTAINSYEDVWFLQCINTGD